MHIYNNQQWYTIYVCIYLPVYNLGFFLFFFFFLFFLCESYVLGGARYAAHTATTYITSFLHTVYTRVLK